MENAARAHHSNCPSLSLWLAANPLILLLVMGGWLCETVLLLRSRNNIYQMAGIIPILTCLLLGWFWLTCGWIISTAVHAVRCVSRPMSVRAMATLVCLGAVAMLTLLFY